MRVILQQIEDGHEEIIIKYREMTGEIADIIKYAEGQGERLLADKEGQKFVLDVSKVLYAESVDGVTYLYTEQEIYRSDLTLTVCETLYAAEGLFRCSKSMVLNIYHIKRLKSMSGNRIDATKDNGEHVVISRRYAKALRSILRGERS